jgi:hypothetical protein
VTEDPPGHVGSFYGWLWRRLPGPWPVRALLLLAAFALVVVVLFGFVFPWLEPRLPFNQVTVSTGTWVPAGWPGTGVWAP